MLSKSDGEALLGLAKNSILSYFNDSKPSLKGLEKYSEKQGVFVTLHKKGHLRGCIGYPQPIMPLNEAIIDAAQSAAFKDPRFPPLTEEELEFIDLEISVLTTPEEIIVKGPEEYKEKIKIGKHGLIIKNPKGSGLLLPQVPVEMEWNIEDFLKNICFKAGLYEESWKSEKSQIFSFEAQIFSGIKNS